MYKLIERGVKRLSDNSFVPQYSGNRDWQEFQDWLDRGNTPEPRYTQAEIDKIERQKKISRKREELKEELRTTVPSQSLPGLDARVEKLEIVLGIKEPEIL